MGRCDAVRKPLLKLHLDHAPGARDQVRGQSRPRVPRNTAVMSGGESARLAKALIEFREAEGVSERELARRTWLSEATIRTFERDRGDLPTPTVARTFEDVLGWAPGSIKTTQSETMGCEPSADSAMDLDEACRQGCLPGRLRSWSGSPPRGTRTPSPWRSAWVRAWTRPYSAGSQWVRATRRL
ncbi:helix-turn-helix transcriptional regulator [Streptomyces sp. NPDC048717]|uniref:helix-turn-helix domain-containing protein n=1 Tax=Streptomyces sp. NPDC048717 TaxID=3154928 RepID=UPI00343D05FA